jgi:TonB family protein
MSWIGLSLAMSVVSATLALAQSDEGWKQEAPKRLSTPPLRYPDALRQSGTEGVVVVVAIIDTTGRVNPQSFRIMQSPDPRLNDAAKEFVAGSIYRPARVNGKAVQMPVQVPVAFKLH